jgi:sulfite reductase alpha subunit-like flavoprotein
MKFIAQEFPRPAFSKALYQRLSNTFGHIAHYNQDGFYCVFFERDADKLAFLDQTLRWRCYGDPTYTFCDVERAVQRRLRAANVIEVFRMREADATRKRELDILARLQAKYGADRESPSSSPQTSPSQADLFAT